MGEKSLALEKIELEAETQRLSRLLEVYKTSYDQLGKKNDIWRTAAEQCEAKFKQYVDDCDHEHSELQVKLDMSLEAFRVAVEENKRYRAALEKVRDMDGPTFAEAFAKCVDVAVETLEEK